MDLPSVRRRPFQLSSYAEGKKVRSGQRLECFTNKEPYIWYISLPILPKDQGLIIHYSHAYVRSIKFTEIKKCHVTNILAYAYSTFNKSFGHVAGGVLTEATCTLVDYDNPHSDNRGFVELLVPPISSPSGPYYYPQVSRVLTYSTSRWKVSVKWRVISRNQRSRQQINLQLSAQHFLVHNAIRGAQVLALEPKWESE